MRRFCTYIEINRVKQAASSSALSKVHSDACSSAVPNDVGCPVVGEGHNIIPNEAAKLTCQIIIGHAFLCYGVNVHAERDEPKGCKTCTEVRFQSRG